jgi:hypothetical protein
MPCETAAWIEWIVKPGAGVIAGIAAKSIWEIGMARFAQRRLKECLRDWAPRAEALHDLSTISILKGEIEQIENDNERALALRRNRVVRRDVAEVRGTLTDLGQPSTTEAKVWALGRVRKSAARLQSWAFGLPMGT